MNTLLYISSFTQKQYFFFFNYIYIIYIYTYKQTDKSIKKNIYHAILWDEYQDVIVFIFFFFTATDRAQFILLVKRVMRMKYYFHLLSHRQ